MKGCLLGNRAVISGDTKELSLEHVNYSSALVKKVVHIFRNPLDNIVARFHLDRKIRARNDPDWLQMYPNDKEGFKKWCSFLNNNAEPVLSSDPMIDKSLMDAMKNVPCVSEFYRYVQWHNLAFATTSELQVPSFIFHYEDYSTRFEDVTKELTDFLGLEQVGQAPEFIVNKKYGEYYTAEDKRAITIFIREFATKPTWKSVQHYLSDFLPAPTSEY
jgi:hypothetical protein